MKRIILITIAVLMAMPVFAQGAEFRKKLREINKEGWELFGSSKTINDALREHYEALAPDDVFEVVGAPHEATAVRFTEPLEDDTILYDGETYYCCEPTSNVGKEGQRRWNNYVVKHIDKVK